MPTRTKNKTSKKTVRAKKTLAKSPRQKNSGAEHETMDQQSHMQGMDRGRGMNNRYAGGREESYGDSRQTNDRYYSPEVYDDRRMSGRRREGNYDNYAPQRGGHRADYGYERERDERYMGRTDRNYGNDYRGGYGLDDQYIGNRYRRDEQPGQERSDRGQFMGDDRNFRGYGRRDRWNEENDQFGYVRE